VRSTSDLTSAALIREAAMRLFAERGQAAVTIRDIAADAGVSPSLVIHHYGSKERLKQAVDATVTEAFSELIGGFVEPTAGDFSAMSIAATFADHLGGDTAVPAYIRRLLVDGGPPAQALFSALFDATLRLLGKLDESGLTQPSADARARAAFLLVNDLGVLMLRTQIAAVLGVDPFSRPGLARWSETVMQVYTGGVFSFPAANQITESELGHD
jgi:TetR/AcrR family transcriptional regulator, regulator of cefoperazone and chloramphenicol sensitivity